MNVTSPHHQPRQPLLGDHLPRAIGLPLAALWQFLSRTGIYVPLLFLGLMVWLAPHVDPQDWDYDEGINLMKVLLFDQGYTLYTDIWTDQPPLLTPILSGWFALFGTSVAAARGLIMLFSALLLWSLFMVMRTTVSEFAALVAVILLVLSEYYLRLSGPVMVGLPALALATLALALPVLGKLRWWSVVLSAAVMATALGTKLFVAVFAPAIGLYLLFGPVSGQPIPLSRRFLRALVWGAVVAGLLLAIGWRYDALRPDLLLGTHFGEQTREQPLFVIESNEFLRHFFKQHAAYLLLGLAGVLWALKRRDRGLLLPLSWFLVTLALLFFHRPLWYHHVMLLTIPLVWLCAFAVDAWARAFSRLGSEATPRATRRRAGLLTAGALLLLGAMTMYPNSLQKRFEVEMRINRPNYIPQIAEQLKADAQVAGGWVFTDHPFYAFDAGLPVPPPIATLSRKRLETGIITEAIMVQVLEEYRPQYVVLERFKYHYGPRFMELVNRDYELIHDIEPALYYRLR